MKNNSVYKLNILAQIFYVSNLTNVPRLIVTVYFIRSFKNMNFSNAHFSFSVTLIAIRHQ